MESLAPVRRINVLSKQKKNPKYFKAMEIFYKTLHVLCLLDFGFFEFKSYKQRIFWKSIATIKAISIFCLCILNNDYETNYVRNRFYCIYFCYFFNVLSLILINPNNTFYKLFFDLESIDYRLKIDNALFNSEVKVLTMSFFFFCLKVCITFYYAYCTHFRIPSKLELVVIWSATSLHFVLVSYSFAFYVINCRLKEFVSILKSASSDLSSLQLIYKRILEITECRKTAFDFIFALALFFNIPHVMASLFDAAQLCFVKNITDISIEIIFKFMITASDLMILCTPAICAGMLATQADRIKIILHEKLMQVRDASRVREIEIFIGYVEARDCRFRVWKLIPLDANLPGMLLKFCVTYLIVIVQFDNK